ncbi:MAG: hypothetical protein ACJAYU_001078 [Bradymonadia bacterium]|jgi:hypothetical protein
MRYPFLASLVLFAGCTDDNGPDEPEVDTTADVAETDLPLADVEADADASDATAPDISGVPDVSDDVEMGVCGPIEPTHVFVVSELRFARDVGGVSPGFDLDSRASDGADRQGCQKVDFESVEGVPGVDNQFARLLPAIEAAGGLAFEGLIQDAINAGNILILFEMESADSLDEDDCVSVIIQRGEGLPIVNRDNRIEGGQTFDRNTEITQSRTDEASIVDGLLTLEDVAFEIPAYVFTFEFLIPVTDARIEMQVNPDGTATGIVGGGISVDALIAVVNSIDGAGGVPDAVTALAPGLADLFPDENGDCQSVSVALELEAVPAFFYQ